MNLNLSRDIFVITSSFKMNLSLSAFLFQQDLDAEFTAARLLISKMKGEILTVIDKAKEAETNLTDQHKIIEQKEKELHEYRNSFNHDFVCFAENWRGANSFPHYII